MEAVKTNVIGTENVLKTATECGVKRVVVGPRPALFNQDDLIALRTEKGVHELLPGLTGWAQVNGRDELPIPQKVELDAEYLQRRSLLFDLKVLWMTALKVLARDGVSH